MNRMLPLRALPILVATLASACAPGDADRATRTNAAYLAIVAAEDARPSGGAKLDQLLFATNSESRFLRSVAVRALGRLEDPSVAHEIAASLDDPAPEVRIEAANALAQAYFGREGSSALPLLVERSEIEHDASVRGAVASALGRLNLGEREAKEAATHLLAMSEAHGTDAPREVMVGVALGLESLARSTSGAIVRGAVERRLDTLRLYQDGTLTRRDQARIRALALNTLGMAGRLTLEHLRVALRDESPVVHAAGARWISSLPSELRAEGVRNALFSRSFHAAVEALRAIQAQPRTATSCTYLIQGAAVPRPGVPASAALRTLAIDALAEPCPDRLAQQAVLRAAAAPERLDDGPWQPAAHALVALASLSPAAADNLLPGYVTHPSPFVRTYAAMAAAQIGRRDALRTLLNDPAANVRTASLRGLGALEGRGADDAAIAQLGVRDPQLVMTAAALLEGSTNARAGAALINSLDMLSEDRRETFRDARRAVLERLAELGNADLSDRMIPYLSDYDPVVASATANVLQAWSGRPYFPTPVFPEPLSLPSVDDLDSMSSSIVVLHMQQGGEIHVALHPYVATTNVWRFYRQAMSGYFDGLTFHRWVPNFVIQGGSPNANEYFGGGAFSRDEVGMHHWRGTVGISTRGRDTGDGQIFVNLLDNPRLDHQYTIIGTVIEGLDVVDSVLEGGVIERVEVRPTL